MPVYGHDARSRVPRKLREVTFQLAPAELRRVAAFLERRAADIDAGCFIDGGRHLRDDEPTWSGCDVIVVPPEAG